MTADRRPPTAARKDTKEKLMKQLKHKPIKFTSVARGQSLTPRQARPELFGACQVERGLHDRAG